MSPAAGAGNRGSPRVMGFWEHLDELRGALVRSALAVAATSALCLAFAARLQHLLVLPFERAAAQVGPAAGHLALLTPTEGFLVRIKLALLAGLLLASPVVFWQIWGFVAPGLHARERRLVLPVAGASSLLFVAGSAFGWWVMGIATAFLLGYGTETIPNQWSLASYAAFTAQVMLGLGLVFQLPLAILFLVRLGVLGTAGLRRARRLALVVIVVAVALLPMQDPLSLVLMSAPLYLLYELSILAGRVVERRSRRAADG